MSNAKSLQSECTPYSFSIPKLKLQKDFVDLYPLTFGPLLPYNPHSNVCLFAPPPTIEPPPPPTWPSGSPPTLNHPAPPESPDPRTWTNNPPSTWTPLPPSDPVQVRCRGFGSEAIHLVEGRLVQVGAGLGLIQVGDGRCKGTKGQTLEGIVAGNCLKEQNSAIE